MYRCIYFIPEQNGIVSYLFKSILAFTVSLARMLLCELPLGRVAQEAWKKYI